MSEERFTAYVLALLACGIVAGSMMRLPAVLSANDGSRWNTVWSLNAGKGYVIDDAPYETNDKVIRGGHYYSSKPALMPTAVAGLAWVIRRVAGLSLPDDDALVVRIILILINVLPFAAMVVLYARLLERLGYRPAVRVFCVAVAAFGTYLTSYNVTLNNHTLAAAATFFALYCLIRIENDGERQWHRFFLCGLFSAWAAANEVNALLLAAIILAVLLRSNPKSAALYFIPPALAIGAAFFYTTYLATGRLRPYSILLDPEFYRYEGSLWIRPGGIDAAQEPKWLYLFNMVLGHHGILSLSPVFFFSFYGAFVKARLQVVNRIGLLLTLYLFGFYMLTTHNYGGGSQGMRWFFWLIPFWLISLAPAIERHFDSRLFRGLALGALLVSAVSAGYGLSAWGVYGFSGPWGFPWLQEIFRTMKWVAY